MLNQKRVKYAVFKEGEGTGAVLRPRSVRSQAAVRGMREVGGGWEEGERWEGGYCETDVRGVGGGWRGGWVKHRWSAGG